MKKPSLIARFFSFLLKVLVVFVLMAAIAVGSFEGVTYYLTGSLYDLRKMAKESTDTVTQTEPDEIVAEIDDGNMRNILCFIDDEYTGRQYTALNMMNKDTYAMDLLLIPENAQVTVGNNVLKEIQKVLPNAKKTLMLEDIFRSFGEEKYSMAAEIIENVMGITVSGYDVMTAESLRKFLDMADEVDYAVEDAMSYRNIKGVLQSIDKDTTQLTSEQAMAFLTHFDGTERQESARLERVSAYLQSFLPCLFNENKAAAIAKKYAKLARFSEERDISGEEDVIKHVSREPVTIRILQGAEANGIFVVDAQKVKLQLSALIKQTGGSTASSGKSKSSGDKTEEKGKGTAGTDSKEYSIELYNAAYVAGLAGEWEAYLEEEGYTISLIDSYQEEGPLSVTRIFVTEEGMGEDLLNYFPDAVIEVDDIDTGGDIQVYIGTDSRNVGSSEGKTGEESEHLEMDDTGEEEKKTDGAYNYDLDSYSE